jgi:phosphoglycerol transferase MdoB-like AlkP superfamily enzyme
MRRLLSSAPARRLLGAVVTGSRSCLPVLLSVLAALVAYLFLDIVQMDWDFGAAMGHDVREVPVLTLLGSSVVWAVLLAAWALVGRLSLAAALVALVTAVLAFADHMKLQLRLEPILPSDFVYLSQPGFLAEMVGTRYVVLLGLGGLVLVAVSGWALWFLSRRHPRPGPRSNPRRWLRNLVGRVTVFCLALAYLNHAAEFNQPGNQLRQAYDAHGARWASWSQLANYERNGFVGGMLYNTSIDAMQAPPGYSATTMRDLVRRYSGIAADTTHPLAPGALDDVNVVVVLSESFGDPTKIKGIDLTDDPIPYTHRVMERTPSGTMLAQKFGGGTANMEFEVLTGMSMSEFAPQLAIAYQMLVPDYDSFPSAVERFERLGHDTVAIHPFTTQMYRRASVYPILGFDEFISQGELQVEDRIDRSPLISDASAFNEVRYQIERADNPLFVNLVTMQNHYPTGDIYDDPVPTSGLTDAPKENLEGYLRGLRHSDDALREFLHGLRGSDEKTAVVFYGDHQPPFWPPWVRELNGAVGIRSTPYFMWANFPLRPVPRERLTSPIFLLPMLFRAAGATPPPYYALLDRLHEQISAMESGRYFERGVGAVREGELSPAASRVLADYRLVQYDLSVGHRYAADAMWDVAGEGGG